MMNHTLRTMADSALDILKEAVLRVLYEGTDPTEESGTAFYPQGRVLKPGAIFRELRLPYVPNPSADAYALISGVLDQLAENNYACRFLNSGWAITEKGVSYIEG